MNIVIYRCVDPIAVILCRLSAVYVDFQRLISR